MDLSSLARWVAIAGFAAGLIFVLVRIKAILDRPFKQDLARQRGNPNQGVLYAFTLGMAPWEKESTRMHWVLYLRGIFFHVGIFAAIALFLVSLFPGISVGALPLGLKVIWAAIAGLGAVFGFAGIWIRLSEANTRALSHPDDYFAIFFTSLFEAAAFALLWLPGLLPVFWLVGGLLALYAPFGKIRHCIYFFFSKFFFGLGFGRRGVIGQPKSKYAE